MKTIFFLLLVSTQVFASPCVEDIGKLPTLNKGRVKPLLVVAQETLGFLNKKAKFKDYNTSQIYCSMALKNYLGEGPEIQAVVENKKVRDFLGMKENTTYGQLSSRMKDVNRETMMQKEEGSYKRSLEELRKKLHLYSNMTTGKDWTLPLFSKTGDLTWVSVSEFMLSPQGQEFLKQTPEQMNAYVKSTIENVDKKEGDKFIVEHVYRTLSLHKWAMYINIFAFALLFVTKRFSVVLGLSILSLVAQIALTTLRVYISGRAPITNMYETVMFSGLGALFLALIVGHVTKEKLYVYVGLFYNLLTLMMMNFATGMLSDSIAPLVPVLRDNFWLSTHVTTIILSYGALALSWILANYVIIKKRFSSIDSKQNSYFETLIYNCLKFGVVLLAAGIILGGVWADYSWGRFWGWDPKETWSLIVLCVYMAILHGRGTNWIKGGLFSPLVALAFLSVMMAWFGVNYILASGLHSYGFSEGGAIFLISFFAIQIGLVGITIKSNKTIGNK